MSLMAADNYLWFVAIDPSGLLCQSRDMNGWHGTRSNRAVFGSGEYCQQFRITYVIYIITYVNHSYYIVLYVLFSCQCEFSHLQNFSLFG